MQKQSSRPTNGVKSYPHNFSLNDRSRQALAELNILYPDSTPAELLNHLIQVAWCRRCPEIEAAKGGAPEDVSFCLRARQAGFEVWCHPGVRVGHVGVFVAWPDYFLGGNSPGNIGAVLG